MIRYSSALGIGLLLLLSLFPAQSLADGIPAPPEECPSGSHPYTSHDGTGCIPNICPFGSFSGFCAREPCCRVFFCGPKGDSMHEEGDCHGRGACRDVEFCVAPDIRITSGNLRERYRKVMGSCEDGCPEGSSCERFAGCVDPALTLSPEFKRVHGSACACDMVGMGGELGWGWLMLGVATTIVCRKRLRTRAPTCIRPAKAYS